MHCERANSVSCCSDDFSWSSICSKQSKKLLFLFFIFSFSHKSQCYKNLLLAFTDYFAPISSVLPPSVGFADEIVIKEEELLYLFIIPFLHVLATI